MGGGTKWIYATLELVLACLVFLKGIGVPFAGQFVDLWQYIMNMRIVGAALKALLGAATRNSYTITGGMSDAHPPLEDFWKKPEDKKVCGYTVKKAEDPPEDFPFPQRCNDKRGTPEHVPVTDFTNVLLGNERGKFLDIMCAGVHRGYEIRFKVRLARGHQILTLTETGVQVHH